jgi:hypothetical protein
MLMKIVWYKNVYSISLAHLLRVLQVCIPTHTNIRDGSNNSNGGKYEFISASIEALCSGGFKTGTRPIKLSVLVSTLGKRNGGILEGMKKKCLIYCYFYLNSNVTRKCKFQFYLVYNNSNIHVVNMTSWETCLKAYIISKKSGAFMGFAPVLHYIGLRHGPNGGLKTAPRPCASNDVAPPLT